MITGFPSYSVEWYTLIDRWKDWGSNPLATWGITLSHAFARTSHLSKTLWGDHLQQGVQSIFKHPGGCDQWPVGSDPNQRRRHEKESQERRKASRIKKVQDSENLDQDVQNRQDKKEVIQSLNEVPIIRHFISYQTISTKRVEWLGISGMFKRRKLDLTRHRKRGIVGS